MPGKVKIKIIAGRNLPVMDRSSDTTDAYVEIKLGNTTYKTDVCRKSLNPQWNSEWYRFEVDDSELQDEPLQIRLMDHDTYSANDAIGKVYLNLNPLLISGVALPGKYGWAGENVDQPSSSMMSGWIPVYDTMHGIRGEVNITVKVELFSDFNKFRQSSCGVQFFCSSTIPHGFYAQIIHGFIEELVVNDDPEYQWIDKIRTPRASNEARQTLFLKLSGELQRKIGVKTLELGGNAVIGYNQCFDLEGESGIVARGIGTVVTLVKHYDVPQQQQIDIGIAEEKALSYLRFLAPDNGLKLNNNNLFDRFMLSPTSPLSLSSLYVNIERNFEHSNSLLLRQQSQPEFESSSLPVTTHMSSRSLTDDIQKELAFKQLLHEEEMRGVPNYRLTRTIRNFKSSSQNMLSKKMIALKMKAKMSNSTIQEQLDTKSEDSSSIQSPLYELRKLKKSRPKNSSSSMAELLVRSVMQAHTSLDCIHEIQDSGPSTSIDEELLEAKYDTDILQETPVECDTDNSFMSDEYLLFEDSNERIPSSSSESSSSDDVSDNKDEDNKVIDFDTVSLIVRNVQEQEENQDYQFVTSLNDISLVKKNDKIGDLFNSSILNVELDKPRSAPASVNTNDHFTFTTNIEQLSYNPLYTDTIKAKRVLSKGISRSCEHIATTRSSLKSHGFKEIAKHIIEKVTIPTLPMQRKLKNKLYSSNHFRSNPDVRDFDLVKTAMQTMLMEKVNLITSQSPIPLIDQQASSQSNPDFISKNQPLVEVHSESLKKSSPKSESDLQKPNIIKVVMNKVLAPVSSHHSNLKDDNNLVKMAMQTMLMDKVSILSPESVPKSKKEIESNLKNETDLSNQNKRNFGDGDTKLAPLSVMETVELDDDPVQSDSDSKKKKSIFGHFTRKYKSLNFKSGNLTTFIQKYRNSFKQKQLSSSNVNTTEQSLESETKLSLDLNPNPQPSTINPKLCTNIDDSNVQTNANIEQDTTSIRFNNDKIIEVVAALVDTNSKANAEHAPCLYPSDRRIMESPPEKERLEYHGHQRTESTGCKMSQSPARLNTIPCIHRRSSDSDLSITPKGNSLTGSDRSTGGAIPGYHHIRSTLLRPAVDNFDMMEYPFLTMSKYPPGFILHLGGTVSARSVKLLERITNIEEPETRDTWWSELRMEIRTHAKALNCNAVLGYTESTSICDEVCVLSASGTAAVIAFYNGELNDGIGGLPNLHKPHVPNKDIMTSSLDRTDFERDKNLKIIDPTNLTGRITESPEQEVSIEFSGSMNTQLSSTSCKMCHIPYNESSMSFRVNMVYCAVCKSAKVPDIILATIEMPEGLSMTGRGCFLQSYVCRPKRDLKGELNAKEISESLPFLEYELYRLLVNKMKVKAMNTIFGLKVRITIGEKMLIGVASGTAVFLLPLPSPPLPKLIAGHATTDEKKLAEMQRLLIDTVKKNKEIYELKDQEPNHQPSKFLSDTDESDDERATLDLTIGNKDSCVLEVDDSEDIEVINLLVEPRPPDGFHVVNTETVPGLEELEIVKNLQMFTQVWRAKIPLNQSASHFGKHFQNLLKSVYFKLRRMIPCAICDLQFNVDLPEPDEIQFTLLGMALGLGDPTKLSKFKRKNISYITPKENMKKLDDELIFNLEEDQIPENNIPVISHTMLLNPQVPKLRQKSPQRIKMAMKQKHTPIMERYGVDITPLSYIPGGRIERYLGYLNFFFIRESTSIREGGGLSGFVHSFLTEVLAIVRAHVTALGGNAMVAYFMTECILCNNAHKNQGQCLINVGGDVVFVSYFPEDA